MKKAITPAILCFCTYMAASQNVGIGTSIPAFRLHVFDSSTLNKSAVYGYAVQTQLSGGDQQNTGITGFGKGNGIGSGQTSYGIGVGVKGIGSPLGYSGVGVYAGIAEIVPELTFGNFYYALMAEVASPANNRFAASFMYGNVGIGTKLPTSRLHVTQLEDVDKNTVYAYAAQTAVISADLQNTAIAAFGQGNGIGGSGVTSYGYGFGLKAIGSIKSYGAIGVYAGIGQSIPNIDPGHSYTALFADAGTVSPVNYAGIFMNGNVGIGLKNPQAKLQVSEGSVVAAAAGPIPGVQGTPPVTGSGRRMMWYADKAAFRTGYVSGIQWDKDNVGNYSFAAGYNNTASGNYSNALGALATASGDFSLAVGYNTTASGDRSMALGSYVSTNNFDGALIIGDNSTTTVLNSASTNSFRARFANGYRFYTTSDLSVNAYLGGGSNAWSTSSDVRKKENFETTDGEAALEKIARFNLGSWNYKGQDPKIFRHYGPMAQEFYAAFGSDHFGSIGNDTTINQADFDGINLIAIAALEKRTSNLLAVCEKLKTENEALKASNEAYKTYVSGLLLALNEQIKTLVLQNTAMNERLNQKETLALVPHSKQKKH